MQSLQDLLSEKRSNLKRRLEREGLESITHLPYEKYLRSALWLAIREWIIERDKGACTICEGAAVEIHHHDYDESTMWGEQSDSLTALCAHCHQLVEFDDQGQKRDCLVEKRQIYDDLRSLYIQLKSEKFQCSIKKKILRASTSIHIQYEGKREFLKFVNLTEAAYSFCITSRKDKEYREAVKYPMPFGHSRLEQKSGLTIKDRETNKALARIQTTASSITLSIRKDHSIPFEERLSLT